MALKNGNAQNRLAKESLFAALMILMGEKQFKSISITEITRKAGVSRMAFYRNYDTTEDIIVDFLEENFVSYAKDLGARRPGACADSIRIFFTYFKNQSTLIRNLIASGMTHLLLESFSHFLHSLSHSIVCEKNLSAAMEKYSIAFIAGGIYKVVIEWAKDDMTESDGHMAEIVGRILAGQESGPA